ncbi:MAG: hypothetical protein FYV88_1270, partial [Bacteroidetes bacterium]|nr:hypothetical protein [Bacteroidota bacterium]
TSTNAHYLTDEKARETVESGLDRLIISIDGTTQDVYEQYRVGGATEQSTGRYPTDSLLEKETKKPNPLYFFPVSGG